MLLLPADIAGGYCTTDNSRGCKVLLLMCQCLIVMFLCLLSTEQYINTTVTTKQSLKLWRTLNGQVSLTHELTKRPSSGCIQILRYDIDPTRYINVRVVLNLQVYTQSMWCRQLGVSSRKRYRLHVVHCSTSYANRLQTFGTHETIAGECNTLSCTAVFESLCIYI